MTIASVATASPPGLAARVGASATGMAGGRVAQSVLGFAFWAVAARTSTPATVGVVASVLSAMMLASQVANAGLGNAVIQLRSGAAAGADRLVLGALGLAAAAAAVVAVAMVAGADRLDDLRIVSESTTVAALFVAVCVLGTANIVLDQVSMARGAGQEVLVRNLVFGTTAVVALLVTSALTGPTSVAAPVGAFTLAALAACTIGALQLGPVGLRPIEAGARLGRSLVALGRSGARQHAATLADRVAPLVLPLIVVERLGSEASALWYPAWMMAWAVTTVPLSVGMAMFAAIAEDHRTLRPVVARSLRLAVGGAAVLALAGAALVPIALRILGPAYGPALGITRLLLLATVPNAVVQVYFSTCRGLGRLGEATAVAAGAGGVAVAIAASAGSPEGIAGCWLAVQVAVAAVAAVRLRTFLAAASGRS